jgi:dolichol-phosphate mannosyltransferase
MPDAGSAPLPRTAVVVPTYNEAQNIVALIDALLATDPAITVYIVDDSSPDGTAEQVRKREGERVRLISRSKKDGRGGAVMEGLRRALGAEPPFERFIEMDADFSHEPRSIPDLVRISGDGVVAIGSRYEPSSRIEGWPLKRRLFSALVNRMLRWVVDRRYSDLSNGFRCYTRASAGRLAAHAFSTRGYIVLSEQAMVLRSAGLRPASIPTLFVNRVRGVSNVNVRELTDAAKGLLRLCWMRMRGVG